MLERQSFIGSAVLHVIALLAMVLGLPHFFAEREIEEQPIAVELVNIAPETHATQQNPTPPVPQEKPEVAQNQPQPQPPKPEPPPSPPPPPPAPPPPTPPPEPKPQAPKPEPPPPPPPAPKPPQPQAKPDTSFDQLLKNLANRQPPQQQQQQPGPPQKSSQPIASLADQLTTSELDVVKAQIEACWNVPAGARDAANLTPEFRVMMNADGTVRSAQLLNTDRMNDPFFQAAAESANRALLNPRCQPLKLPLDKYDQWQTFTITFDPKDLT